MLKMASRELPASEGKRVVAASGRIGAGAIALSRRVVRLRTVRRQRKTMVLRRAGVWEEEDRWRGWGFRLRRDGFFTAMPSVTGANPRTTGRVPLRGDRYAGT
jgi:hypothetical protein